MGCSPVLALLLPMSFVVGAIVYFITGSIIFAVLAFAFDVIPVGIIYTTQLRARRERTDVARDRLTRYSTLDDR